jgi:hypothetical protein
MVALGQAPDRVSGAGAGQTARAAGQTDNFPNEVTALGAGKDACSGRSLGSLLSCHGSEA